MKRGHLYSVSDKALFEALNQTAVTSSDLRQLFLNHGIVISKSSSRQELALYYSRLIHGFDDFQNLARLFDTGQRRERVSSFRISSSAQLQDYEDIAHQVVQRLHDGTDSAGVIKAEDGSLKITVRYKKINFNKSEFRQIETKTAVITIEQEGDAVIIRGPENEKVDEICRDIISTLETVVDDFDIDDISLELFPSPSDRTQFFIYLIERLTGYKKYTVTDVYVFKPKSSKLEDEDNEEVEDITLDNDSDDPPLGIHISKASLKGEGVLDSEEMGGLIERGFYISKIVWQAKETGVVGPDIFEFEAQFSEPETCTKFSYLVRGHYKYQGNQQYSKTRTQLSAEEDKDLSKIIESAARSSLIQIRKSAKENPQNGED